MTVILYSVKFSYIFLFLKGIACGTLPPFYSRKNSYLSDLFFQNFLISSSSSLAAALIERIST